MALRALVGGLCFKHRGDHYKRLWFLIDEDLREQFGG